MTRTADEIFADAETLDRKDVRGAMKLWREAREVLSPSDLADLVHTLRLLSDDPVKLQRWIARESARA